MSGALYSEDNIDPSLLQSNSGLETNSLPGNGNIFLNHPGIDDSSEDCVIDISPSGPQAPDGGPGL